MSLAMILTALAMSTAFAALPMDPQIDDTDLDAFLEADMGLPCTPKPCVPVCRPVTKYLAFGSFKIPYVENVCAPDHKCLAAAAACVAKLQAAMVDAHKKGLALEAASKAKNAAHASKASKDKAAAARKAEAAAAATALGLAKFAFQAAEEEAANAKAAKESASKMYTAKAAVMDARLKTYEKAQQAHKNAVAAYDGAKSEAAKAAAAYADAVKAHCDAEAQHAAAVKNIGHGHLAQKNCAKYAPVKWVMEGSGSLSACRGGNCGSSSGNTNCDKICAAQGKKCDQSAINSLTSTAKIHAAFAAAGFKCKINDMGCQTRYGGGHCASWGSPYLYNQGSYLSQGRCFFGSGTGKHVHASCGRNHADGNHRRLCPCK